WGFKELHRPKTRPRLTVRFTRKRSLGERRRRRRLSGRLWLKRKQFLPEDRNIARRLNAQANLAPVDVHHGDPNVVSNANLLAELSAQHQHDAASFGALAISFLAYFTP